VKTVSVIDSMI